MRLMSTMLRVIYSKGCVTMEELLGELQRLLGRPVNRSTVKSYAWYLKQAGKITSPSRGVYCSPSRGEEHEGAGAEGPRAG